MNIWQFQFHLTRRLLIWSVLSMVTGGLLQVPRNRFTRGMGQQFAAWGLVNALIAIFGQRSAQKQVAQLPEPPATETITHEAQNLRNILWINTGLDVGYVAGGTALALTKGKTDPGWRGHGIGIIIQGALLFFFDLFHALKIRNPD
jgi:hypothetical protein